MNDPLLRQILAATGDYAGEGINSENQKFRAEFTVQPVQNGKAAQFRYHEAPLSAEPAGKAITQDLSLVPSANGEFVLSVIAEGQTKYRFTKRQAELGAKEGFVFNHGATDDLTKFRAEICLSLYANGDVGYRWSAAAPGEALSFRTSVRLTRASAV